MAAMIVHGRITMIAATIIGRETIIIIAIIAATIIAKTITAIIMAIIRIAVIGAITPVPAPIGTAGEGTGLAIE